jgi:hypothetical protein
MKLPTFHTDSQKFHGLIKTALIILLLGALSACSFFKKDKPETCLYNGAVQTEGSEIYLPEKCELCTCQSGSWTCVGTECKDQQQPEEQQEEEPADNNPG